MLILIDSYRLDMVSHGSDQMAIGSFCSHLMNGPAFQFRIVIAARINHQFGMTGPFIKNVSHISGPNPILLILSHLNWTQEKWMVLISQVLIEMLFRLSLLVWFASFFFFPLYFLSL